MPELPEVEYTARQLRANVIGATISSAQVFWERTVSYPDLPDFLAEIADRCILNVRRRAKYLLLDLSGELFLSIHRRMTGNLLLLPPGWEIDTSLREADPAAWNLKGPSFSSVQYATSPEIAYCRGCFNLADGRRLLYTDPRKFGRIELWPREREAEAFKALGLEPLDEEFTVEQLEKALAGRRSGIKQVLLTQEAVAGLGNIYADEALYYAFIHPLRRADSLTAAEIASLHTGIVSVLTLGIEHGGTSFSGYRDLQGETGNNYDHLRAYHKQKTVKICERCGTQIERMVIAQRSAHFCPECQQLPT
ncbi:MAG: bifunctional DNA-formamidopyrimidine glycosylase/DNA-(apurinic or apyrimidinic site) lyase [Ktedonobacteraceae bacterium]